MPMLHHLKAWAKRLKCDILTLWLAAKDSRVPLPAKLLAAAVAAYALSPIDLIPDFIPVLGYLDDLILVPLGIGAALKLIPQPLLIELRTQATHLTQKPTSRTGLAVILLIWTLTLIFISYLYFA